MINNVSPVRKGSCSTAQCQKCGKIIIGGGLQNQKNRAIALVSETTKYAIK